MGAWVAVAIGLSWRAYRREARWTDSRLAMTHDLVEQMVGHRTRLVQEAPGRWHQREDRLLKDYVERSIDVDRTLVVLDALAVRGWMLLALVALAPELVLRGFGAAPLAVTIGGILLAGQAFGKLTAGVFQGLSVLIAWRRVKLVFHAATRREPVGHPDAALPAAPATDGTPTAGPLVEAEDLVYRFPRAPDPALRKCRLRVDRGDRILLQGPSGSGKSTLGAVLSGLRPLDSGVLRLEGLDRATLGARGWRGRVALVPQFHENYVFTGTLAFNLLMGRGWPPSARDLADTLRVCEALGLGELLDRMPAGLMQMVGESGWQLSHGERSRVFIARGLLQAADLIVLDESLGALDAANAHRVLRCVLDQGSAVLMIAHP